MDELKQIYERITLLRQKGIKMKEIAGQTGFSPSVLSALYSTVLPAFFQNQKKGMNNEEALDQALVWVNNISKKKLLGSLPCLKASLFAMQVTPKVPTGENDNLSWQNWKPICGKPFRGLPIIAVSTSVTVFLPPVRP